MTADFFSAEDFREHTNWHHAALAETANRLLRERAQVVCQTMRGEAIYAAAGYFGKDEVTHTALLVCVTPIARDSAEKIVEDLIARFDNYPQTLELTNLVDRARALKAGGK